VDETWQLPSGAAQALMRGLRSGEDTVVQHYVSQVCGMALHLTFFLRDNRNTCVIMRNESKYMRVPPRNTYQKHVRNELNCMHTSKKFIKLQAKYTGRYCHQLNPPRPRPTQSLDNLASGGGRGEHLAKLATYEMVTCLLGVVHEAQVLSLHVAVSQFLEG
jgi:hypothetical protein